MTTEIDAKEEAKKIWDQLEAEERGDAAPKQEERVEPAELTAEESAANDTGSDAPPAEVEDDPKVLRNKLAGMEAIINQLSGRLRNAEGHIGGLNNQVKAQVEAARKAEAAGAKAPTAREIGEAQGDPQAMADLERDYPEFSRALKPALDAVLAGRLAEFEKRIPQGAPQAQQPPTDTVTKEELQTLKAEMAIEARHAGWQNKVATAEFIGWIKDAPRELKALAGSKDPEDAIRLLDVFEDSRKTQPPKTSQRHTSAAALPNGQRSAVRTKNVDDMTPQEYWRYLDQLDKQKA